MYYQTVITYSNPSTAELTNCTGLCYAKSDAEALGIAIAEADKRVPKGCRVASHAVYPIPDHPYSKDNAVTISNANPEGDVYITLLARKIPRSLPAVFSLLYYLDDIEFGEPTVEAFKKIISAKSHQEKLRVLVDFLRAASHLAEDLGGGANEYQVLLIETLAKAIVDFVSAAGGSDD